MTTPVTDPLIDLIGALAAAGKLTLHNGRGGFACNSSSSHSIVVLPAGATPPVEDADDGSYGSSEFTLTDSASKIRYLAALVGRRAEARPVVEVLKTEYGTQSGVDDYVDHQSSVRLPEDWHGDGLDPQFLLEFGHFLARPDVAIIGGSDSGERRDAVDNMVSLGKILEDSWRARKDTQDGYTWWTLFSTSDGTKLRFTFDSDDVRANAFDDPREKQYRRDNAKVILGLGSHNPPTKAPAPELVDIKLTDACAYEKDCGFCYMQSTRDGDPGDPVAVRNLLSSLSQLRVFEVAFGGGEPTLWPEFSQTLAYARSVGIVPNFTTKNYSWVNGPDAKAWFDSIGAVAFSVNDRKSMDRLVRKTTQANLTWSNNTKISVQLIPDLVPEADFRHIIKTAADEHWRVTLLGYKDVGRGATFTPAFRREPGWWFDVVADIAEGTRMSGVAIDTALALQSRDKLEAAQVPSWMYHVEEGTFSAYVDAVTGRMGPSSYTDPDTFTPIDLFADVDDLTAAFTAQFATYTPESMAR